MLSALPEEYLQWDDDSVRQYALREIGQKNLHIIQKCISDAITGYHNNYVSLKIKHSARSDSSLIHDLIVDNIKNSFEGIPGATHSTKNNLFLLSINNGTVVIRFKKMDKRFRTHNVPTQQSFAFNNQLTLVPSSINVNAGYIMNGLEFKTFIVCPEDNNNHSWVHELLPKESSNIVAPINKDENEELVKERHPIPKEKEMESYVNEK